MDPEKSRLEEQPLLPAADVNHGQHVDFQGERVVPNKRRFRFLGAWLALLLLWNFSGGLFAPLHRGRGHEKSPTRTITNFPDILPSEKLQWVPCYEYAPTPLLCARLTVPMDYHRPLSASKKNPKVEIALMMAPGKGHIESGNWSTSPLLLNPGGPGGSGTFFVLGVGNALQAIVGEDQDIIGFDPRGIAFTKPSADCWSSPSTDYNAQDIFDSSDFKRNVWIISGQEIGLVNSSNVALTKLDNRARGLSMLCKAKDDKLGDDSILRHIGTPNVARDMISIIDAWDAWQDDMKSKKGCNHKATPVQDSGDDGRIKNATENPSESENHLDTKGKLVYWGFSYGTLLGATFSAMFPDRVGRVILDGVVDADHYVGQTWKGALQHSDLVLKTFFRYCHEAGERCAFSRSGETDSDIEKRYLKVMDDFRKNPIIGLEPASQIPMTASVSFLRQVIFSTLYAPIGGFPIVAEILDALEKGKDDIVLGWLRPFSVFFDYQPYCSKAAGPFSGLGGFEAQKAIVCADKRYKINETIPVLEGIFQNMSKTSTFADVWISIVLGCDGWAIPNKDPPMRWDDHPAHKPKPINTSFPLLFISNTYDPVTPLPAGLKMARQFTNAGFFEVLTEGHCSLAAPSLCSFQKISSYLRVGIVPKPPGAFKKGEGEIEQEKRDWETCRADGWPWKSPVEAESQDLEGQRLLKLQEAWERVEGASRIAGNWLGRGLDLGVMEGKRMSDRTKEWMAMYVDGVENHECDGEFSDCL